jgi:hypothetical protein
MSRTHASKPTFAGFWYHVAVALAGSKCLGDPSRALFEQFAADQHAADFARVGADLVELGVTQQAPERIVVGVAVSGENLDGVARVLAATLTPHEAT